MSSKQLFNPSKTGLMTAREVRRRMLLVVVVVVVVLVLMVLLLLIQLLSLPLFIGAHYGSHGDVSASGT